MSFLEHLIDVHMRLDIPDELRERFVEPFRSMPREILEPVSVTMHLQKRQPRRGAARQRPRIRSNPGSID